MTALVTTPTKTAGTALLAHTQQATATVTVGSAVDVSGKLLGRIYAKLGRSATTAFTNEMTFRLEASAKASGNDEWFPILTWRSGFGKTAAVAPTVNDASFNAGDTSFTISSATSIVAGSLLYFRETGTPANSEWCRVAGVSGTTITLEEATTRNHTNGITVTNLAEYFSWDVDLSALSRIRLVVDSASAASGVTADVIAWLTTLDSVSTV
jgi:hypothetical protein